MSAKVNLLPQVSREQARRAGARWAVAGILIVVIAVLGGVYWWLTLQVQDAEDRLAVEEQRTAELNAEVRALADFAELERRLEVSSERLQRALEQEVSFAGFLQDVALVMPADAQVENLAVNLTGEVDDLGVMGNFSVSGKSLSSHAPGVERLLLQFDRVVSFSDPFLTSSSLDDPESEDERITSFSLDGRVNQNARTQRYEQGLPEVFR